MSKKRRNANTPRRRNARRGMVAALSGHARSMTVGKLCNAMEQIAPTWAAAEWDNVGLLAGDPDRPLRRALLTIDMTPAVLHEAIDARVDAIVSYHPPIFRAVKRFVVEPRGGGTEALAAAAFANGIAVYSPHTALDSAPGGTNDAIVALCKLKDVRPFEAARKKSSEAKLVTFVPVEQVTNVAEALFAAGAGRIGEYEKCSYRVRGQGTFFGTDATNPAVGRKGRLEHVEEMRIEVLVPLRKLDAVVAAMRKTHPYEEPAFDLYPLESHPDRQLGQGRIGKFAKPVTLRGLARALARKTGARNVQLIEATSRRLAHGIRRMATRRPVQHRQDARCHTALICVGSAGTLPFEIPDRQCGPGDVVITGEIRHHDALAYQRAGVSAIALGHWASERPVLTPLATRLRALLPGVAVVVSRGDGDPFRPA